MRLTAGPDPRPGPRPRSWPRRSLLPIRAVHRAATANALGTGRRIARPVDVNAVAQALIDTARQIADQQALADKEIEVAPPEIAKFQVAAETKPAEVAEVQAASPEPEKKEPAIEDPPPHGDR